ncbi:MAG: peptidylprolyl isomerase, partial [Pseudomonadota bacterium]
MLHLLRAAAKTWIFKGVFGLLIVSFAVWGIGDLSLGGAASPVASVGERRVTVQDFANALSREVNSFSRQAGRPIQMDEAQAMGIPDALLARIIRDAALDEEARQLGLSAPDGAVRDAILDSPSFVGLGGTFDAEQYRFILSQLGFTVERFERDQRRFIARETVRLGVAGGIAGAPGFAEAIIAREFEARRFDTLTLPLASAPEPGEPTEGDLIAHHEANAPSYEAPEMRRAVWVEISAEALAETVDVPEADIRAEYDAQIDRFDLPERRVVERIVYPDDAAARAALADLQAGAITFLDAAEARGLAPSDTELGEVERRDLGAAADAVFAAGLDVAGPAPTEFGPALFNVVAVLPARTTPYEDASEDLRAALAMETADALAAERAEEAADLLAAGAPLEEIAQDLRLPLRKSDLTLDGEADALPQIVAEAFSAEAGEERELIEAGRGFALVRVDEIVEAAVRPLDQLPLLARFGRERLGDDLRQGVGLAVQRQVA